MQLDATRKKLGYESIAAVTCVYSCRYDLLQKEEFRPDTEFNVTAPASYSESFRLESRFVNSLSSLKFSVATLSHVA